MKRSTRNAIVGILLATFVGIVVLLVEYEVFIPWHKSNEDRSELLNRAYQFFFDTCIHINIITLIFILVILVGTHFLVYRVTSKEKSTIKENLINFINRIDQENATNLEVFRRLINQWNEQLASIDNAKIKTGFGSLYESGTVGTSQGYVLDPDCDFMLKQVVLLDQTRNLFNSLCRVDMALGDYEDRLNLTSAQHVFRSKETLREHLRDNLSMVIHTLETILKRLQYRAELSR